MTETQSGNVHAVAHIYALTYVRGVPAALDVLDVLDVIAEPTRRRILDAVRDSECSVNDLVELVGMHQPGVSRHLRVLRDAGLVQVRRDAQRRLYRLRPEPLMELDTWLEPYRAHWADRLDALERHLKRTSVPIPPTSKESR
jgi:DNA-binding transcriptional ArsR family regulator